MPDPWERTGPNSSRREEIRVQYQARATRRWREFGDAFSTEQRALDWAASMLIPEGGALAVRIYRQTITIEVLHDLSATV